MEVISEILKEYGMTGVFILVLIYAVKRITEMAAAKDNESNDLEKEFRGYLMKTQTEFSQIIKENTEAFKEFSKTIVESNYINQQVAKELNKLKNKTA